MLEPVYIYVWSDNHLYCYEHELDDFKTLYGAYDCREEHADFFQREDIGDYLDLYLD